MTENKRIVLRLLQKNLFYYVAGTAAACAAGSLIGMLMNYINSISFFASLAFFVVLVLIACVIGCTYLEYKSYKKRGKFLGE